MDRQAIDAEPTPEYAVGSIVVLEPRSSYPEDDLITPGEFDIA